MHSRGTELLGHLGLNLVARYHMDFAPMTQNPQRGQR
jgi:hypothetical protein